MAPNLLVKGGKKLIASTVLSLNSKAENDLFSVAWFSSI